MNKIFEHYKTLLIIYTEEVELFEEEKDRINKEKLNSVKYEPYLVINSRIFHFDEWLTNPFHNYYCYEQKKKVLPLLIKFISAYNKLNEDEKDEFENNRLKNKYQVYLDEIWKPVQDFIAFLDSLKKERENLKQNIDYPVKPSRPNATRQLAEYEKKKQEYLQQIQSHDNCLNEISEWKMMYESFEK